MASWSPSQDDMDRIVSLASELANLRVSPESIIGYDKFRALAATNANLVPFDLALFTDLTTCVKPEKVVEALGIDALMWTRIQGKLFDDGWTQEIEASTLINASVLMQARTCMFQVYQSQEYQHVKTLYSLLTQEVVPKMPPMDPFTRKRVDQNEYSIIPVCLPSARSGSTPYGHFMKYHHVWELFLDAPAAAALCYKEKPEAVIAYMPNEHGMLMIHQLQGVRQGNRPNSWGLEPLDWRALLVQVASDLAKEIGSSKIGIVSAQNNPWTRTCTWSSKIKLPLEVAIKAYDQQAMRLGFTQNPEDGNFYQTIL